MNLTRRVEQLEQQAGIANGPHRLCLTMYGDGEVRTEVFTLRGKVPAYGADFLLVGADLAEVLGPGDTGLTWAQVEAGLVEGAQCGA